MLGISRLLRTGTRILRIGIFIGTLAKITWSTHEVLDPIWHG